MTRPTVSLGIGRDGKEIRVGKVGLGLMLMTWQASPVPDEQCFAAIKAGIDSLDDGVKLFINGGEFYGHNLSTANIEMIRRFFDKYPEYIDRTFLSVKGGLKLGQLEPDSSEANLERSVSNVLEKLGSKKRLDLFQSARVDPKVPVIKAIGTLAELTKKLGFDHIGMSECKATSLEAGNEVHHITAVEIEVSPWSYEDETKRVIEAARKTGTAVIAYSPLGRGFLTGQIKSHDDLPEGDFRRNLPRFQEENMKHNMAIVDGLTAIAKRKGITAAQLCIAWVASLGDHVIPLPGSSLDKRTLENSAAGDVILTNEECAEIEKVVEIHTVKGTRYSAAAQSHLWG
ncbi:NADP-dependent oxidoreductase domain-containing protein [Hygrophoropsis aurantiaca]|uniref:NADP-dependent oxidoreductase domain-containing protein n=1 Tax=Hygrophoropsis aurantiaca TaxID=72124 RepID=A0ACB8AP99_9AGAM|nr:NADP-dependent oxidoreductase domain-containing protein [Hygrophoropsis aurantiaca]